MIVVVRDGAPGTRKSLSMLADLVRTPGRYVVFVPRIELMKEHAAFVTQTAAETGCDMPEPLLIHAENRRKGDVRRQIEDAARDLASHPHTIVFITHEAMRTIDLSPFLGWHARIDEVPDGVVTSSFKAGAAYLTLSGLYELQPDPTGWSKVIARQKTLRPNEVLHDESAKALAAFHKYAALGDVFVNISDWSEVRGSSSKVTWMYPWTLDKLDMFSTVEIACANFEQSLCYKTSLRWMSGALQIRMLPPLAVTRASPSVTIRYFTRSHQGTTTFWGSHDNNHEGRGCLNRVARHFEEIEGIGFWSGNEKVREYMARRFPGELVLPKLAGTNSLLHHTSCALIYSSKAQDGDDAVYGLFDIDRKGIKRARETEDIIQFVMRGAIRRPEYDGTYDIYVYESAQAEAVQDYLRTECIATNIILEPVMEAGLLDHVRDAQARSNEGAARRRTADEQRAANNERASKSRELRRSQKIADGTYVSPGRPRKHV